MPTLVEPHGNRDYLNWSPISNLFREGGENMITSGMVGKKMCID